MVECNTLNASKKQRSCLWICLQSVKRNSFTEFYDQLLKSKYYFSNRLFSKAFMCYREADWSILSNKIQLEKAVLKEMLVDFEEKKFSVPLMISFTAGCNNCQGIRFQTLANAEMM